jgi:hypothetical protein
MVIIIIIIIIPIHGRTAASVAAITAQSRLICSDQALKTR